MADLRQGVCPKCDHRRTLHLTQLADRIGEFGGGDMRDSMDTTEGGQYLPWRIARVPNPEQGIFTHNVAGAGLVEAYVCAACGFTEMYTRNPAKIPVDGKIVREIHGPKSEGPFR